MISSGFNKMEEVLLILLLLAFLKTYSTEATNRYLNTIPSGGEYTSNSTYGKNLKTTLSYLSSVNTTAAITSGFANDSTGQGTPDSVYGLYLCRGDVSPTVCGDCVKTASQEIIQRSLNKQVSIIWYDLCMLRYSNSNIFSFSDAVPGFVLTGGVNATDPDQFRHLVLKTLNDVIPSAAKSTTAKKFATGKADLMDFRTLYTLAQCTPDILPRECEGCLQEIVEKLQFDTLGGRFFGTSCNVRFELYPFYDESGYK